MTTETCRTVWDVVAIMLAVYGLVVALTVGSEAVRDWWWNRKHARRRDYARRWWE
jgi:hypothetical protein